MKLLRIIKHYINRRQIRQFLYLIVIFILVINCFFFLVYIDQNKNELVYNKYIKIFLPIYRSTREAAKIGMNLFYLPKMVGKVDIPEYKLEIKAEDWQKLDENLPSSISDAIFAGRILLTDEYKKTVPAKFIYEDKEYKIRVRYRGDNPNHWTRPKRSWQIRFNKENPFDGLRVIKLIIPDDRGYFAEYLDNYRAKKLGLFFPEAEYVKLNINGDDHGIYYQIEDWSKEFLEKNKQPADANLYITNDENIFSSSQQIESIFNDIKFWDKQTNDKIFSFDNYAELDFLINLLKQKDFYKVAPDIIDLDNFYRWQIISILAGSNHQGDTGNIRIYFNNSKGKFEFIPWDVGIKSYPADAEAIYSLVSRKIFTNPMYLLERNKLLWEYVSNKDNLEDDLRFYDEIYKKLKPAFYADWKKHDSNFTFDQRVKSIRQQFENNFNNIEKLYKKDDSKMVIYYDALSQLITINFEVDNFSGLNLQSISLPIETPGKVALYYDLDRDGILGREDKLVAQAILEDNKLKFNDLNYFLYNLGNFDNDEIDEATKHIFFITLNNIPNNRFLELDKIEFDLVNAITNEEVKIEDISFVDNTTFSYLSKINLSPAQFVQKNRMFSLSDENIVLRKGNYYIKKDIIIPKESLLKIEPGTILNFSANVSLVSYSPIIAEGTAWQPIIFRAIDVNRLWGVVGVLNCGDNKSIFKNTVFRNGSKAYINGVFLSGMLSFYHSNLELTDSLIEGAGDDDGLNVKYAKIKVNNNKFINNSADAVDLDYSNGIVESNYFEGNGNDSIDISDSDVLIKNNYITKSGDKCISIGEKTKKLVIFNNILDGCKIGVETKDGSTPIIINNVIVNNEIGLNSYRKKAIFIDGGFPKVYNSIIWGNQEQVKDDKFSKTEIYYSDIENGFGGKGNFIEEPLIRENEYESFTKGGDANILKEVLEIDVQESPIGLFEKL